MAQHACLPASLAAHATALLLLLSTCVSHAWLFGGGDSGSAQSQGSFPLPRLPRGSCSVLERRYQPGKLETEWARNVETWQEEANYCKRMASRAEIRLEDITLRTINTLTSSPNGLWVRPHSTPLLSQMTTTLECSTGGAGTGADASAPIQYTITEAIEPLFSVLRIPAGLPCPDWKPNHDLYNLSYVMMSHNKSAAAYYAPKAFYFDLGASTYGSASQSWMLENYASRGINFDRMFLWEAQALTGEQIHKDVPDKWYPAFQFFNMPATADPNDRRNPLNILKAVAKPEDFVAFKLDIDFWKLEFEFIEQIFASPEIYNLIDEFYFEMHFNFGPMVRCCWGETAHPNYTLADGYKLFRKFRDHGIRAHYWV